MRLEIRVRKSFNGAIYSLFVFAFLVHLFAFIYEAKTLTQTAQSTIVRQVMNISNMVAKNGDFLYLQMYMTSILEPVAENLRVDINLVRVDDGRSMVSIHPVDTSLVTLHKNKTTALFEVNPLGSMKLIMELDMTKIIYLSLLKMVMSFAVLIIGVAVFKSYINRMNSRNLVPIDEFSSFVEKISPEDFYRNEIALPSNLDSTQLGDGFSRLLNTIKVISTDVAKIEVGKRSMEVARRVAHDIRSPVSVLNALSNSRVTISDEERNEILNQVSNRINQIADGLLSETKNNEISKKASPFSAEQTCDIREEMKKIIGEKSIEWSVKNAISIVFKDNISGQTGCLTSFPSSELARIVSNLINNAAEASLVNSQVYVELWRTDIKAFVKIMDFGEGISDEILHKLKTESISTKTTGSGIGVFAANQVLSSFGHSLDIHSKVGVGTQVIVGFKLI